jgi:uncharacterized LabA/DUF88 family protein
LYAEGYAVKNKCLLTKAKQILESSQPKEITNIITDEQLLEGAYQELVEARCLFTQAQEPDMVDYAVFRLKAAEQRYDYLIRRIKLRDGYKCRVKKGELDGNN